MSFRENSNGRYHHFNFVSTSPIFSYTGFQMQSSFQDISKSSFFISGHRQYRVKDRIVLEVIWSAICGKFFFLSTFYSFKLLLIVSNLLVCSMQPFHLYVVNSLIDFEAVFNELNLFAFDWHFYLSLKTKFKLLFSQFWKETPFNSSRTIGLWLLAHCSVLINIYIFMFSLTF